MDSARCIVMVRDLHSAPCLSRCLPVLLVFAILMVSPLVVADSVPLLPQVDETIGAGNVLVREVCDPVGLVCVGPVNGAMPVSVRVQSEGIGLDADLHAGETEAAGPYHYEIPLIVLGQTLPVTLCPDPCSVPLVPEAAPYASLEVELASGSVTCSLDVFGPDAPGLGACLVELAPVMACTLAPALPDCGGALPSIGLIDEDEDGMPEAIGIDLDGDGEFDEVVPLPAIGPDGIFSTECSLSPDELVQVCFDDPTQVSPVETFTGGLWPGMHVTVAGMTVNV